MILSWWLIFGTTLDDDSIPDFSDPNSPPDGGESMPPLTIVTDKDGIERLVEREELNKNVAEFLDSGDREFIGHNWSVEKYDGMFVGPNVDLEAAEKNYSRVVHDWETRLTAKTAKEARIDYLDGYQLIDGALLIPAGTRLKLKVHANRKRAVLLCSKNKHASMWFMERAEQINVEVFPTLENLIDLVFNPDPRIRQKPKSGLRFRSGPPSPNPLAG